MRGTVKNWNVDRGFGFILRDDGQDDLFVHVFQIGARDCLVTGQQVEFDVAPSPKNDGKLRAVSLKVL